MDTHTDRQTHILLCRDTPYIVKGVWKTIVYTINYFFQGCHSRCANTRSTSNASLTEIRKFRRLQISLSATEITLKEIDQDFPNSSLLDLLIKGQLVLNEVRLDQSGNDNVCQDFIVGQCNKENCPYSHITSNIKWEDNAMITDEESESSENFEMYVESEIGWHSFEGFGAFLW